MLLKENLSLVEINMGMNTVLLEIKQSVGKLKNELETFAAEYPDAALSRYCQQDTWAMVEILRAIRIKL